MYKTAYETTAARQYDLTSVLQGIQYARVDNQLLPVKTPDSRRPIANAWLVSPANSDVPLFNHPIRVDRDPTGYVVDSRGFCYPELVNEEPRIRDLGEYRFQVARVLLQMEYDTNASHLLTLGDLPGLVFIRWVAGFITKRLGLAVDEQLQLEVITYVYWYSQFRTDPEFSEQDLLLIFRKLHQIAGIESDVGVKLMDELSPMMVLGDYIENAKRAIHSVRMQHLNIPLLFAMLGGSWFGLNARETAVVSIEHPPTFIAMVLRAIETRTYQKAPLGRIVYDNDRRDRGKQLSKSVYRLFQEHTV